jgi:hypothetical protein
MFDPAPRPDYATTVSTRAGIPSAVLIWLTFFLLSARIALAQGTCLPECNPSQPSEGCCPECVQGACAKFEECLAGFDDEFEKCVSHVVPIGGHCKFTRDLLAKCRARRAAWISQCRNDLRRRTKRTCRSALGRRCHIGRRAARRACESCSSIAVTATTTTSTTTIPSTALRPSVVVDPQTVNCQNRCINRVAASCYGDCAEACEGDGLALAICQHGCRNDLCTTLQKACTDTPGPAADQYRFCCTRAGDCADVVDCNVPATTTRTIRTTTTFALTTTTLR